MMFFKSLANKGNYLDQNKLKAKVQDEFGELTEYVLPFFRRVFANFRHNIDFKKYYIQYLIKFLSLTPDQCKEILFQILDLNKDKRVCETDLFMSIKNLKTVEAQNIMYSDIHKVMEYLNFKRKKL